MREQFFYQHKKCLVQAQYFANVFFLLTFLWWPGFVPMTLPFSRSQTKYYLHKF